MANKIFRGAVIGMLLIIMVICWHGFSQRHRVYKGYYDKGYSQGYIDGGKWVWGQLGEAPGSYRTVTIFLPSEFREHSWSLGPGSPDVAVTEGVGFIGMQGKDWCLYYSETRRGGEEE